MLHTCLDPFPDLYHWLTLLAFSSFLLFFFEIQPPIPRLSLLLPVNPSFDLDFFGFFPPPPSFSGVRHFVRVFPLVPSSSQIHLKPPLSPFFVPPQLSPLRTAGCADVIVFFPSCLLRFPVCRKCSCSPLLPPSQTCPPRVFFPCWNPSLRFSDSRTSHSLLTFFFQPPSV